MVKQTRNAVQIYDLHANIKTANIKTANINTV